MQVRTILLGAAAFAGVTAGAALFGPGLPGVEAEPAVLLQDPGRPPESGAAPGATSAQSASGDERDDDEEDEYDDDEEDDDGEDD
jgi:hypothetical protein